MGRYMILQIRSAGVADYYWKNYGDYSQCIFYDSANERTWRNVYNAKLVTELGGNGSLTFTLTGEYDISTINLMTDEFMVIEKDNNVSKALFIGRPVSLKKVNFTEAEVFCEGALAYLHDILIRPNEWVESTTTPKSYFRDILSLYNSKRNSAVDGLFKYQQINVGNITVPSRPIYRMTDYESAYEAIQRGCIDTDGGYLMMSYGTDGSKTLNWYKTPPSTNTQGINYGKNIVNITETLDYSDASTAMIPLSLKRTEEKKTIDYAHVVISMTPFPKSSDQQNIEQFSSDEVDDNISGSDIYQSIKKDDYAAEWRIGKDDPIYYNNRYVDPDDYFFHILLSFGLDDSGSVMPIVEAWLYTYDIYSHTEITSRFKVEIEYNYLPRSSYINEYITLDGEIYTDPDFIGGSGFNSDYRKYGYIEKAIKYSDDNIETASDLQARAAVDPAIESRYPWSNVFTEVGVVDLHYLDDSVDKFELGQKVKSPSNLLPNSDRKLYITRIEQILGEANPTIVVGSLKRQELSDTFKNPRTQDESSLSEKKTYDETSNDIDPGEDITPGLYVFSDYITTTTKLRFTTQADENTDEEQITGQDTDPDSEEGDGTG